MSYWHVCPHCGAYLDPGEKCDCMQEIKPAAAEDPEHMKRGSHEEGPGRDTNVRQKQEGRK